ncbi:hypothetical protein [Pseudomonas gozinkensis]|uniref:hypothetical protein n=1 Tax=Pseudomonas gozinkensis TaxID=2774461 RepID=UPI001787F1F4|nr:hypothetical protein [Pseudomonas gozinkensis]
MFTQYLRPLTKNNPCKGTLTADVSGETPFTSEGLGFANDYSAIDDKLHLALSTLQNVNQGVVVMQRGFEMVFDADIKSGTYRFEDKKVFASYWTMRIESSKLRIETFSADTGTITVDFDDTNEMYEATFSFKSTDATGGQLEVTQGRLSIKGRDDIIL